MLKNKCSVWKRIKFPTFWYNCYYFTWSDTHFIQLETLLINHPSYIFYVISIYRRKLYWTDSGYCEPIWYNMRHCLLNSCFPQDLQVCLQGNQFCFKFIWICATRSTKVQDLKTEKTKFVTHTWGAERFNCSSL